MVKTLLIILAYFIALPLCIALHWYRAFLLLITVPLGGLWTVMAISGLLEPFQYAIRGEGRVVQIVYDHKSRRGTKFYKVECNFGHAGKGYQRSSEDYYLLQKLEKKYTVGETIPIWINRKNPLLFRVKRYFGELSFAILLGIGIGFLGIAAGVIFMPETIMNMF